MQKVPQNRIYDNINYSLPDNLDNVSSQLILINSADRNWNILSPNNYTISLQSMIRNVISIQLVDYKIPYNPYNITTYNNTIYYQESNNQVILNECNTCKIPEGKYDIKTLLEALEHGLHENSIYKRKYKCYYDTTTLKITIRAYIHSKEDEDDALFNLIFTESKADSTHNDTYGNLYIKNSIGKTLGFIPKNKTSKLSYTADHIYNLNINEYVSLYLSTGNGTDINQVISSSGHSTDSFAIIPTFGDFGRTNVLFLEKDLNPTIDIERLTVKFLDSDGNPYDFHGKDHYLLFNIKAAFGRKIIKSVKQLMA